MSAHPRDARRLSRFRDDAAAVLLKTVYDDALAHWPAPPAQRDVESRYGPTHILASGSGGGTPIVLLHGLAVSSPSWFADVATLSESHPVYAVDTITDAGRSTQTSRIRDGSDLAAWLDDVLAALDLESVHLVGLSYGGWLAAEPGSSLTRSAHQHHRGRSARRHRPRHLTFLMKIVPDSVLALANPTRRSTGSCGGSTTAPCRLSHCSTSPSPDSARSSRSSPTPSA